jgi:hypothetical protein
MDIGRFDMDRQVSWAKTSDPKSFSQAVPKSQVNGIPVNTAQAYANWPGRRSNDQVIIARPELASNVLQFAPAFADALFALVPGAVSTEYHSARDNDKSAAIEASTGVPRLGDGCSYEVPCNTNSTITFQINNVDYDLAPAQWVIPNLDPRRNNWEMCKTRVYVPKSADSLGGAQIILGAPFLETVYTALRYSAEPELGFGKL